ncbi:MULTISPECIES: helix-turn-helix domain-containing protein [Rhizobium]|uniref:helix-turn-helix domain-containing protein n=1 Tax=Rhizobium TaxID=379 RepID=UPI00287F7889|nr:MULTISPECIES: helix-turn-helix transcriptional regulator [Rhizobium]
MSDFSEKLRSLCAHYRSVSDVCRMLGLNRQQFDRYLTGRVRPSQHNLQRIATGLGVGINELIDPNKEVGIPARLKELSGRDRMTSLIDRAFPGDLKRLRTMLGYYHTHFLTPSEQDVVVRSVVLLFEWEGRVCSKTIERTGPHEEVQEILKYEGMATFLGNCLFLLEFETLSADTIVESVLYPSYRKSLDILTGLTFGMTSHVYRQPFASPIAWKYLGRMVDVKEQLRACGSYKKNDVRIDPRIRKYMHAAGISGTLSLGPM